MLSKYTDIDIPAENPFANDKLERRKFVENLTLLVQSTNQPFVISVEAPWGWGKTTLIKMWQHHLETSGHICLYFNAWENDFVGDPLIAFVGEIGRSLGDKKSDGKVQAQFKTLQSIGGKIVRRALPLAIQIATHGILSQDVVKQTSDALAGSGDEIAKFASEVVQDGIKHYEDDKNGISEFKKELAQFAASISDSNGKRTPVVFFIDELDRCKPDFAISLLERMKHIFSAKGIVFILSIDRQQIEQSIKSIYGQGMSSDGYLRRFIDFRFRLPMPSTDALCNSLLDRFEMKEIFDPRPNGADERDTLVRVFTKLAQLYRFSARVIEQSFTEINVILRTTKAETMLPSDMLAFLVAIRSYKPQIYARLKDELGPTELTEVLNEIRKDFDMQDSTCESIFALIEANIIYNNTREGVRNRVAQTYDATRKSETAAASEKHYASRMLAFMDQFDQAPFSKRHPYSIKFLMSRLDAFGDLVV